MGMLKFKDGVRFNTGGNLHIEKRFDGYYVVGGGILCPVKDWAEGKKMIKEMKGGNGQNEKHEI